MHYQENVSFLVKKFCESGKCRRFPEKNNRIAGLRCEVACFLFKNGIQLPLVYEISKEKQRKS